MDRQTDRQTESQKDGRTVRHMDANINRQTNGWTWMNGQADGQTVSNIRTNWQTDEWDGRTELTNPQTDKQTERQTEKLAPTPTYVSSGIAGWICEAAWCLQQRERPLTQPSCQDESSAACVGSSRTRSRSCSCARPRACGTAAAGRCSPALPRSAAPGSKSGMCWTLLGSPGNKTYTKTKTKSKQKK